MPDTMPCIICLFMQDFVLHVPWQMQKTADITKIMMMIIIKNTYLKSKAKWGNVIFVHVPRFKLLSVYEVDLSLVFFILLNRHNTFVASA